MRVLKNIFSFMFSRLFLVLLMLIVQIGLLVTLLMYFSQSVFYVYLSLNILSFVTVIGVVSNSENPSYKLTWTIAILIFPLTGGVFYLLFGNRRMPRKLQKQIDYALENTHRNMTKNDLGSGLEAGRARQGLYVYNMSGNPLYTGTSSEYYPLGEIMFDSILKELEQAKRFIFLEFFIVRPGIMWDTVFDVLKRKIGEGVEVWVSYDDLGCINTLPRGYDKIIRDAGVRLLVFNPFRPRASMILNNRDHRKLIVIDGNTAFCGGVNMADEYINRRERFGHWKDTGVMLKGEAVWSMTFMFLQMWQFSTNEFIDFDKYRPTAPPQQPDGLVQPFGDSPLDKINVTESLFLDVIYRAKEYVYITTPYLIIDNEMERALCSAAQAGIDVRIITPYIYDKWYVHLLTRSHYAQLVRAGVRIYEYLPGFMHGKMLISDDDFCLIGTCNMDFRSFYLHFECCVTFYGAMLIERVKKDMLDCQKLSHEVTLEETMRTPLHLRLLRSILKLFAPLM